MTATPCSKHSELTYAQTLQLDPIELVPDDWYADPNAGKTSGEGIRRRRAKQACLVDCPSKTRLACLQLSLDNEEDWGVWGGYDARERRTLLDQRNKRRTP